jgi:hypothetical protein
LLSRPNPDGRTNADVIRPWIKSLDIVRRPRDLWIIDFGPGMAIEAAALYEAPFEYVKANIKPGGPTATVRRPGPWGAPSLLPNTASREDRTESVSHEVSHKQPQRLHPHRPAVPGLHGRSRSLNSHGRSLPHVGGWAATPASLAIFSGRPVRRHGRAGGHQYALPISPERDRAWGRRPRAIACA